MKKNYIFILIKIKTLFLIVILLINLFILKTFANEIKNINNNSIIRIIRDEYGVPHIFAKNIYDLYFGYGYVTAEDRLFQLEILKRSVTGSVSEILGEEFLELDKTTLREGYSTDEINKMINKLNYDNVKILEMFANGINKKINEIYNNLNMLPIEFKKFNFMPSYWTKADVASIFIGTMVVRYSDFSLEIENLKLLNNLINKFGKDTAYKIFNDIVPFNDINSTTTINEYKNNFLNTNKTINDTLIHQNNTFEQIILHKKHVNTLINKLGLPTKLGSYAYLISSKKSEDKNAILGGGPQMGFFYPAYLFEVGLHLPDKYVIGTTTPGYMNIIFGMNQNLAFTATAGVGNLTDIVIEHLNPQNFEEYLYEGKYIKFEKRKFKIKVKGKNQPIEVEFLKSKNGPICLIDEKANIAYARKRAWEGLEIESMFYWMNATFANNFDELKFHFLKIPISINIFAINKLGEIFYCLSGKYPIRNINIDDRLPIDTKIHNKIWLGFFSNDNNPSIKNPNDGFIVNWNSKPTLMFRNGDLATQWGPDQRTKFLKDIFNSKEKFNFDDFLKINKKIGYTDLRAYFYCPLILSFIEKSYKKGENTYVDIIYKHLKNWNYMRLDENHDGYYDTCSIAIFDCLWQNLLEALFKDELEDMLWLIDSDPTWTQSNLLYYTLYENIYDKKFLNFDYTNGIGLKNILNNVCKNTILNLKKEFKTYDISKWLKPVQYLIFDSINFLGVPQTEKENTFKVLMVNRGTSNHFIKLSQNKNEIIAININPPGQSGYKAINDIFSSKHCNDQLSLFENYNGYKKIRFELIDILKNKSSKKLIIAN